MTQNKLWLSLLVSSALMIEANGASAAAAARVNARADEVTAEKTAKKTPAKVAKATKKDSTAKPGAKKEAGKAVASKSKADKSQTGKSQTGKSKAGKSDAEEKTVATASKAGTPFVMPDKSDKYDNRKTGNLAAAVKKTAKATPKPKPVQKAAPPKVQTALAQPKAKAPVLAAEASQAVTDLLGGTPARTPAPVIEEKVELPAGPMPYVATVKPDVAPQPRADVSAPLMAAKLEPKTIAPPTQVTATQVATVTPLPEATSRSSPSLQTAPLPSPSIATAAPQPQVQPQAQAQTQATSRVTPQDAPSVPSQQVLASVKVDEYGRDYEGQKTSSEARYDSGVHSGLISRQNRAGALEGNWLIKSLGGEELVSLALRGGGASGLEGAWRTLQGGVGMNRSGLIDQASQADDRLMIDYQSASAKGRYRLDLKRESDGRWRGQMIDPNGGATPVVMQSQ